MKKFLLLSVFSMAFLFWAGSAFAQCTPDPGLTDPEGNGEMAPDTLEGWENTAMNITLSIISPLTTDIGGGTITLHHITIKSITNKPAWMSYACNPGTCEYNAGSLQCALVTGTPPTGSADTILMDVLVDVFMNLGGAPIQVATDYNSGNQLVLIIHPPAAVEEFSDGSFGILQSQPNPFTDQTKIGCYTSTPQKIDMRVMDILGSVLYSESMTTQAGENYFNFNGSTLRSGVYFYTVSDAQGKKITRKMVKTD